MAATSLEDKFPLTRVLLKSSGPENNHHAPATDNATAQIDNKKIRIRRDRFMRSNTQRSRRCAGLSRVVQSHKQLDFQDDFGLYDRLKQQGRFAR
jgi:hypothetical protein